jgi:cyclase
VAWTVVNTHANGDHWYGNELVTGAEIIASQATADGPHHR